MTSEQFEAFIAFVNETVDAAVCDPLGESGRRYQAEKALRAAFPELARRPKHPKALIEGGDAK